jgi:dihydrofolate reductase
MSVDGKIAGPNGEMDWMQWNWDDELKDFVNGFTDAGDCIILGRNLATGFIPYWTDVVTRPDDPQYPFARKMTDTPKIVFTKTLEKSTWENTSLAKGDLKEEIEKIKKEAGNDIIVYGGAAFVSSLIRENLIDELNLFVNPVAVGEGLKIFDGKTGLNHLRTKAFGCGIVVNTYGPRH